MSVIDEPIAVATTTAGRPEHLIWRSRHFRVSDMPTPLVADLLWDAALTHPLPASPGWRVQGTGDDGETRMFDILPDRDRSGWRLLRVYA